MNEAIRIIAALPVVPTDDRPKLTKGWLDSIIEGMRWDVDPYDPEAQAIERNAMKFFRDAILASPVPLDRPNEELVENLLASLREVKEHIAQQPDIGDWTRGHALACDECINAVEQFFRGRVDGPPFTDRELRMISSYNAKVQDFAAETLRNSELRAENEQLKSQLSAPLDRLNEEGECPTNHARVEILARVDESTVDAVGTDLPLSWSPICRDCGADVPMAAE